MDLLIKRGSKKAVDSYIGQKGELFLDQENDSLRMSDASTAGGLEILKKDHNGDCVIGSKRVTWIHNSTNNGYIDISGGTESTFVKAAGASLIMSGADYTGTAIPAGTFYLSSTNGKEVYSLNGNSTGDLLWKGRPVISDIENLGNGIRFSNKVLICWNRTNAPSGTTFNFPYPYKVSPIVILSPWSSDRNDNTTTLRIKQVTTTGFTCGDVAYGSVNKTIDWFAFGYYE